MTSRKQQSYSFMYCLRNLKILEPSVGDSVSQLVKKLTDTSMSEKNYRICLQL